MAAEGTIRFARYGRNNFAFHGITGSLRGRD